jgi:hypothetical protein
VEETRVRVSSYRFEGIAGSESATRPYGHLYCSNTPFLCSTILQSVSLFFFSRLHTRRRRLQGGVFSAATTEQLLPAWTLSATGRKKYLQISKKERMRASWSPRRARQMSNPRRRVVFRNVRLTVVPAEKFVAALRSPSYRSSRPNPTQNFTSFNTKSLSHKT